MELGGGSLSCPTQGLGAQLGTPTRGPPGSAAARGGWGSHGPCVHPCLSLSQGTLAPHCWGWGAAGPPHRRGRSPKVCPCLTLTPLSGPPEPPSSPGQGDMHRHSDRGVPSQDRQTRRGLQVQLDTWKALWMVGQWERHMDRSPSGQTHFHIQLDTWT